MIRKAARRQNSTADAIAAATWIFIASPAKEPEGGWKISVSAEPIADKEVIVTVTTNLPLPVEIAVGYELVSQEPGAPYVGEYIFKPMLVEKSNAYFSGSSSITKFPTGTYRAYATFYPDWGAKKGSAAAKKIDREIEGEAFFEFVGDGVTNEEARKSSDQQDYVLDTILLGESFNEEKLQQILGPMERLTSQLNQHDAFYFPGPDATIFVRRSDHKIGLWRLGKAHK